MYPRIIGLVGYIRSGKTSIGEVLSREYGYHLATNSDVLKRIAADLGMTCSRENLSALGNAIFSNLGNDAIARARVAQSHLFPMVVDGIRYLEEVGLYRQSPSFKLLGVVASDEVRYQRARLLANDAKDGDISRSSFEALSLARSEVGVPQLLSMADATIVNQGSIEDLQLEVRRILSSWI